MLEEAERSVSKVDNRCDHNERHDPVAKVVENSESRSDEELDQVVAGPSNHIGDGKTSSAGKSGLRGINQILHIQ